MMVIDTVHSGDVGRMHAGQAQWMKMIRPLHPFQGSEAKRSTLSSTPSTAEPNKGSATGILDSRPSLVIRRRIMVPQLEEADEAGSDQLPPALSDQPKSSTTTTSTDHSHAMKMDRAIKHFGVVIDRSDASTQDQVSKSAAPPMSKPPKKMLRLFDLNKLPTSLPDSPVLSPTSTIASADSTTQAATDAQTPSAVVKMFTDIKTGDAHRGGAKLAVDLGVLPPASPLEITHLRNAEDPSAALQELAPEGASLPTPARRRLRKLSEYAGGHMSNGARTAHAAPAACKSWTTDGDDVCTRRDVTKTLASSQTKVRGEDRDVDDEVLRAASVLTMLFSSKKRRREFASLSSIAAGRESEAGPSSPSTTSSRSLGSGGSVLLRPSSKQRYRSMAELMARTPVLKRV